jgi:hypothetical protein
VTASQTYPDTKPAVPKINPTYPRVPTPAGDALVDDWNDTHTPQSSFGVAGRRYWKAAVEPYCGHLRHSARHRRHRRRGD